MGKHGEYGEHRAHGKEGKHQPDLKTLDLSVFVATVEKSYMLDPRSALDWRTLSDLWRPDQRHNNLCSIGG